MAPYGVCLVVPGAEFDPDWEAQLADQGFVCHEAVLDLKPVTLVKLVKDGEKVVYEPPAKRGPGVKVTKSFKQWTEKEDERLLLLWPKTPGSVREKCEKLTIEFPGRSAKAIALYYPKSVGKQKKGDESPEPKNKVVNARAEQSASSETSSRKDWTGEDDRLLAEKWTEDKLSVREIFKQCFPSRSKRGVAMRIWDLQQKGLLQKKRLKGGRPRGSKNNPQAKEKEVKHASVDTSVHTSVSTASTSLKQKNTDQQDESKVPTISTEDQILAVLKEIHNLLKPSLFDFDFACRECGYSGTSLSEKKIWRFCTHD